MNDFTHIVQAWELYQRGVSINNIAYHCHIHRSTLSRWINSIKEIGLSNYVNIYSNAKKGIRPSRQINPRTKQLIWELQKADQNKSGYQIQKTLNLQYHISISISKVYLIMKETR